MEDGYVFIYDLKFDYGYPEGVLPRGFKDWERLLEGSNSNPILDLTPFLFYTMLKK